MRKPDKSRDLSVLAPVRTIFSSNHDFWFCWKAFSFLWTFNFWIGDLEYVESVWLSVGHNGKSSFCSLPSVRVCLLMSYRCLLMCVSVLCPPTLMHTHILLMLIFPCQFVSPLVSSLSVMFPVCDINIGGQRERERERAERETENNRGGMRGVSNE